MCAAVLLTSLDYFAEDGLGDLLAQFCAAPTIPLFLGGWDGGLRGSLLWMLAVCAAYLPAGWLLSHVFRMRERNTPAVRGHWSWNSRSLLLGLGAAVLVGTVLDFLLDRVAGVGWGVVAGLVCWLITAWSAAPADLASVTSPQELLWQDRRAYWGFVRTGALLGLLAGLLLGVLLGYLNGDLRDIDPLEALVSSTVFGCGIGFWSGLVLGLAAALHAPPGAISP